MLSLMAFQKRLPVFVDFLFTLLGPSSARWCWVDGLVSSMVSTWISMISIIHLLLGINKTASGSNIRGREETHYAYASHNLWIGHGIERAPGRLILTRNGHGMLPVAAEINLVA